jgi:Fic family protein
MLFEAPSLSDRELEVLVEVENLRKQLRWQLVEPRRWHGSLRRISMARAIRGSNTIEGFDASLDDAAAVGLGEEPLDADQETYLAYKGYGEAMTYVLQMASDQDFAYSTQLLKSLHFMMTSYSLDNRPGLWRAGAVSVHDETTNQIVYEGADVDLVPALMEELAAGLNRESNVPLLVRAAMSHLNLVMVHPFKDGNGRMARCLQSLALTREGLLDPAFCSIEEYLGANTPEYYAVLSQVGGGSFQPQRDALPWVRFNLKAHLRQARTLLRRIEESGRLWAELDRLAREHRLAERTVYAMFDAAMGLRVRNSTYRAINEQMGEEIQEPTASRDFRLLAGAGFLEPHGESRGRYYTATPLLNDVRKAIVTGRDARDDRDPFPEFQEQQLR